MEYQLKRLTRSRSIRIRLDRNNQVVVTAPMFVPLSGIEKFVEQSQPWIERQRQRVGLRQMANPTINWDEGVVSYLGNLYFVKKGRDEQDRKVMVEEGSIYVLPVTLHEKDIPKTLIKWLKFEAERIIRERSAYWADMMHVNYREIGFGQQSSRWGSCTGDNRLRFNWRLIHFSMAVIDYVVIHELSHTIHHDHSDRFWRLVEQYCPSYKEQVKFLKRQVVSLVTD